MKNFSAVAALVLLFAVGATAQTTNVFSEAEIQGRALAQKILAQWPAENFTNTGVLKTRAANGSKSELTFQNQVILTTSNWSSRYQVPADIFPPASNCTVAVISHAADQPDSYYVHEGFCGLILSNTQAALSFAGSDFWLCDLGLEFFHWPQQKVLKKEIHRSCACTVLESTNPHPSTNGYSRVVSWVDTESLGIVEAYAYDANGKKLKNFYPKDIKKVNGQWQVQTLVMENLQTGSKSRLEFDLKK